MNPLKQAIPLAIFAGLFAFLSRTSAVPRAPLPPLPEPVPQLHRLSFDAAYDANQNHAAHLALDCGAVVESWSGHALERAGDSVTPLVVPAVGVDGLTNVACSAGAVRFWFKPTGWGSGTGPRYNPRLLEMTVLSAGEIEANLSLHVSADGTSLFLSGQTQGSAADLLKAEIFWQSNDWHLVTLNYSSSNTALFIDDELVAKGVGVQATAPASSGVVIGSTAFGTETASGEFDEVCFLARPLAEADVAWYYHALCGTAALRPISDEEIAARKAASALRRAQPRGSGGIQLDSLQGCSAGGPPFLTNIVSVLGG